MLIHILTLVEESLVHFATAAVDEVGLVIAVLKALFTGDWDSVGKLSDRVTEELKKGVIDAVFSVSGASIAKFAKPEVVKGLAEASPDVQPFLDFVAPPKARGFQVRANARSGDMAGHVRHASARSASA